MSDEEKDYIASVALKLSGGIEYEFYKCKKLEELQDECLLYSWAESNIIDRSKEVSLGVFIEICNLKNVPKYCSFNPN